MPGRKGRQRRHLCDQAKDLQPPALLAEDVLRVGVEGRERAYSSHKDAHRGGIVMKAIDQLLDVLVEERVMGDRVHPLAILGGSGQLAMDQEVGDLEEATALCELLDWI